jgi:uncharacterized heparinase superfamily protein
MGLGLKGGLSDSAFAGVAARQGMRRVAAGAARLLSPFGQRVPPKLLIAPQDIRTSDPTIAAEIYAGQLKLAGKLLETHGRSPFEMEPPSEAFAVELHGFGWLRHLRASDSALSKANGRALVKDWIQSQNTLLGGIAGRPDVVARRLMSWLSQSPLLLEGADTAFYRSIVRTVAADADRLRRARRAVPDTEIRLMIQVALTYYALSSAESDAELKDAASQLCSLLDQQILSDGGHVSRNPQVLVNLLLDLLPLKLAFLWRRIQTPQPIVAAIDRMMPMLRMMRHADGAVALFNGMGATRADFVAAVLAQDDTLAPAPANAPYTGYQRAEHAGAVLIVDAAAAPAPPLASRAHAAPAAFEFSAEQCRIVVNCGAPPAHRPEMLHYARLTAAHSTLVVADETIGRFTRTSAMKALVGEQFTSGAKKVNLQRSDSAEGTLIGVDHDGYRKRFGVIHERRLALAADGVSLEGEDVLKPVRQRRELDYALRFHIHPLVKVALRADGLSARLTLPNRSTWEFEAGGMVLAVEETIFFASTEGLRRSEQIVVAANTGAHARIAWSFRKTANR